MRGKDAVYLRSTSHCLSNSLHAISPYLRGAISPQSRFTRTVVVRESSPSTGKRWFPRRSGSSQPGISIDRYLEITTGTRIFFWMEGGMMFDSDKKLVVSRYSLLSVPTAFRSLVRQQRAGKTATEFYSLDVHTCFSAHEMSTDTCFIDRNRSFRGCRVFLSFIPRCRSSFGLYSVEHHRTDDNERSSIIRTDKLRDGRSRDDPFGLTWKRRASTLIDSREFVSFEDDFYVTWRMEKRGRLLSRKLCKNIERIFS